jgi:oligopeptide transport system substrate-binding protein
MILKNLKLPHILFLYIFTLTLSCKEKTDNKSKFLQEKQELKILLSDPVETLDPLKIVYSSDWEVANNIFEGLVSIDFDGKIQNVLVDSILIMQDNLTYNFQIKPNVFFQDSPCFENGKGRKLNSSDINYTFERLAKKNYKFSNWHLISDKIVGIEDYYNELNERISGIKVIDSLRFRIVLKQPFSSFLKILANPNFYIVPKEAIEYFEENFELNPVGTGPFRISEYKKYEKIILVKNENYHLYDKNGVRLPYLKSIEFKTIDQTENRISELVRKSINLTSIGVEEFRSLTKDNYFLNDFNVKKGNEGLGVRYWTFYFNKNDNDQFRNLRKLIVSEFNYSNLYKDPNSLAYTLVPPKLLFANDENLSSTQNYLHSSRFNSRDFNDTIRIMANMEYTELLELENIFQKLNLPFRRIIKPDNYYGEISKVKPTLFRVSMTPSFPDAIEYYSLFYSGNINGINLGKFSNSDYDNIYEELLIENDLGSQQILYNKLEQILNDEAAAIYMKNFGPSYYVYSKNLNQLKFNFLMPEYTNAYFE